MQVLVVHGMAICAAHSCTAVQAQQADATTAPGCAVPHAQQYLQIWAAQACLRLPCWTAGLRVGGRPLQRNCTAHLAGACSLLGIRAPHACAQLSRWTMHACTKQSSGTSRQRQCEGCPPYRAPLQGLTCRYISQGTMNGAVAAAQAPGLSSPLVCTSSKRGCSVN